MNGDSASVCDYISGTISILHWTPGRRNGGTVVVVVLLYFCVSARSILCSCAVSRRYTMKRPLSISMLLRKSWRCPRLRQKLICSSFDGSSSLVTFFQIGLTGGANATLSIKSVLRGTMFLLPQCRGILFNRACTCHFLSGLSDFGA